MKKLTFSAILSGLAAAGLICLLSFSTTSCSSDNDPATGPGDGYGALVLRSSTDTDREVVTRTSTDLEDYFVIYEYIETGDKVTIEYPENDKIENLTPGRYSVTVTSHRNGFTAPAFDEPVYAETKEVTVEKGREVKLTMVCTQSNSAVEFLYDDESLAAAGLADMRPTVTDSVDNSVFLAWGENDMDKTGYFAVGTYDLSFSLGDKVIKINGKDAEELELKIKQLLKVSVKASTGSDGTISLEVTVDDEDVDEENIEVTVEIPEELPAPKIGDYYYSDGTWSDGGLVSIEAHGLNPVWADTKPAPIAGKTVVGIVFQTAENRIAQTEKNNGYTNGYAVAVKNAHGPDKNTTFWSRDWDFDCLSATKLASSWYNNINGYAETMTVKDEYGASIGSWMPAFDLTLNSFSLPAPASSSGWFLPATGQLWDMMANLCGHDVAVHMKSWQTISGQVIYYCSEKVDYDVIAKFHETISLIPASDKEELEITQAHHFSTSIWTSTPFGPESACQISLGTNGLIECYDEWYDGDCFARPILAF